MADTAIQTNGHAQQPESYDLVMRALESLSFLDRYRFAKQLGTTFNGHRDINAILGYPETITVSDYRLMYDRGGIAGRVVDALPKATWRGGVELIEKENSSTRTRFELEVEELFLALDVISELEAVDILSQLSTYACLLLGTAEKGNLATPLPVSSNGLKSLIYLQPYLGGGGPDSNVRTTATLQTVTHDVDITIQDLDLNPASPRYGQPLMYRLVKATDKADAQDVHWSRVIHVAERTLGNKIYSAPALERVWNNLLDLQKVSGGGSEAFFQRANQGRLWTIDKETKGLQPEDLESFRDQIDKFQHNITRDVRAKGVDVKTLGSDTANFSSPQDAIITLIAGTSTIPKRILTGSEMGELASSEDRDNWRDQVNGRRNRYAAPRLLRRLVNRLIDFQYLTKPASYNERWGAVMNMTEEEKRVKAKSWADTKTSEGQVFTNDEIRDECYEKAPLTDEQKAALRPVPDANPFAGFPRAASQNEVDELAAAIEANDVKTIERLIGVSLVE